MPADLRHLPDGSEVLITGGGGLIGAALGDAIGSAGHSVTSVTGGAIDVRDGAAVAELVLGCEPALIVHLAGCSDVARCADDPELAEAVHVEGTANVLAAAAALKREPAVICASTRHVYDQGAGSGPLTEGAPLVDTPGYAGSKARADLLVAEARSIPAASLRLTNVYGPADPAGERLIPSVVRALTEGRALELRASMAAEIELLHVDDAVSAYLAVAAALLADPDRLSGRAFNAGSGVPVPIAQVVAIAERASDTELQVAWRAGGDPEAPLRVLDSSRLRNETGWTPAVALADGLAGVVAAAGAPLTTI